MKIEVKAGRPVDLDGRRRTSVRGGVYDVSKLSDADKDRLRATDGVKVIDEPAKASAKKRESGDG